jgi:hypothetical protein
MRRSFTPLPTPLAGIQKYEVAVEQGEDGEDNVDPQIVLSERTVFGRTNMVFCPKTARQVAAYLLKAADAAEGSKETELSSSVPPKLAAVR